MTKRTPKQIKKDIKNIQKAALNAKTLKEVQNITGLSYWQVMTSLQDHTTIYNRILATLDENKKKQDEMPVEKEKTIKKEKKSENSEIKVVLDTSACGTNELNKLLKEDRKFILTSVTLFELENLQKFSDEAGFSARKVMSEAAKDSEKFTVVMIEESYNTADECIIQYCRENAKNVILATADKAMALKARMYGVEVVFCIQHEEHQNGVPKKITLYATRREGKNLTIVSNQMNRKFLVVAKSEGAFVDGKCNLKIGDEVFTAKDRGDYISFAHYRIISLYETENAEVLYSKRIYDIKHINLPREEYNEFLVNFIERLKVC